jgi:hypothetical protein
VKALAETAFTKAKRIVRTKSPNPNFEARILFQMPPAQVHGMLRPVGWGSPADKKNAMRFKRAFLRKRQVHCRFFYNEKRGRNKDNLRQNR